MKSKLTYLILMLLGSGGLLAGAEPAGQSSTTAPSGFEPNWQSLANYQCPDWFRDAKFGIWAHWTAQCVPEQGDWYARRMYQQYAEGTDQNGKRIMTDKPNPDYVTQVERYGHPSKVGFKDIDHLWRAENWDPEKLMNLYKRAGAKYFVALANHHDNFDCYDSKYQPWNSVNIGPKKDLVGLWAKAARKNGLRFGVTVHAARAWTWFEVAQGSDRDGPLAGVPYDGKLTKADGKGTWWEGYDPQDLYAQNHQLGEKPDKAYCEKFYNRTIDLVDKYKPDLLYFDDGVLPLRDSGEEYGLGIAAHLYNASIKWHGRNEAVMNTKGLNKEQRQCLVWDIERGVSDRVESFVWQTDTCIGNWHYNLSTFDQHGYKTAAQVVSMLADIVSKNGNLLLNIPVKGDGTIDSDEIAFLEDLAKWMAVNSEAIFATRPWMLFGEGPSTKQVQPRRRDGSIRTTADLPSRVLFTAEDIRFTTKGKTLYAIVLNWPTDGNVTVKSLGFDNKLLDTQITKVELLGGKDPLKWTRTANQLKVELPAQKPCDHAYVLKIALN